MIKLYSVNYERANAISDLLANRYDKFYTATPDETGDGVDISLLSAIPLIVKVYNGESEIVIDLGSRRLTIHNTEYWKMEVY